MSRFRTWIGGSHPIESVLLVPGGGGIFDVRADGEVVFSKHAVGRHAEHQEILEELERRLGA